MENKRSKRVRHSSGIDKEFTIFDALLESLIKKEKKESKSGRLLKHLSSPWNAAVLFLVFLGSATLVWVGQVIWMDITLYGKDWVTILLGSRVGENISLGVDMRLVYYLFVGLEFLFLSLIIRFAKS